MHKNVFVGLSLGVDEVWAESVGFAGAHADLHSPRFCFVASGNNAGIWDEAVRDGDGAAAQHWSALLLDSSEARVEINVECVVLEFRHTDLPRIRDTSRATRCRV